MPNAYARLESPEYNIIVRNNSRGIRGPEYSYDRIGKEKRILAIGDSFAVGYTVAFEATFGQVAERMLNTQSKQKYTVIAMGAEAYSTDQELLYFLEEGQKYSPDITVLMFFFNDVWFNNQPVGGAEYGSKPLFRLDGKNLILAQKPNSMTTTSVAGAESNRPKRVIKERSKSPNGVKGWLLSHSRLFRLFWQAVNEGFISGKIQLRSMWLSDSLFDSLRVFRTSYDDDIQAAWTLTEALIVEFSNEVQRRRGRFILFHVPERASIYEDEWNRAKAHHRWNDEDWRSDQVEIELRRICAAHSLDCIFSTGEFRERARSISPGRLYLVNDFHWGPEGHYLAGRLLAEHIQKNVDSERRFRSGISE